MSVNRPKAHERGVPTTPPSPSPTGHISHQIVVVVRLVYIGNQGTIVTSIANLIRYTGKRLFEMFERKVGSRRVARKLAYHRTGNY